MEKAIKRAIEGGWEHKDMPVHLPQKYMGDLNCVILLDPLFWQALEKTEGWEGSGLVGGPMSKMEELPMWKLHAINLMSNIMNGKSVDDFFNNLLK